MCGECMSQQTTRGRMSCCSRRKQLLEDGKGLPDNFDPLRHTGCVATASELQEPVVLYQAFYCCMLDQ